MSRLPKREEDRLFEKELNLVTHLGSPKECIDTIHGIVRYRDWCNREIARMQRKQRGDKLYVVERPSDGWVAIARL